MIKPRKGKFNYEANLSELLVRMLTGAISILMQKHVEKNAIIAALEVKVAEATRITKGRLGLNFLSFENKVAELKLKNAEIDVHMAALEDKVAESTNVDKDVLIATLENRVADLSRG